MMSEYHLEMLLSFLFMCMFTSWLMMSPSVEFSPSSFVSAAQCGYMAAAAPCKFYFCPKMDEMGEEAALWICLE